MELAQAFAPADDADIAGDLGTLEDVRASLRSLEAAGRAVVRELHQLIAEDAGPGAKMGAYATHRARLQDALRDAEQAREKTVAIRRRTPIYFDERGSARARRYRELVKTNLRVANREHRKGMVRIRWIDGMVERLREAAASLDRARPKEETEVNIRADVTAS